MGKKKINAPGGDSKVEADSQGRRSTTDRSVPRWKKWLPGLLLLLVTLAAYYPAWHGGMLWDDDDHVTRPELRSGQGLARIWFEVGATVQYYPLLHSAFWLQHKLWGDSTLGYHLVNILLHVLAACMVAAILRRLAIPGAWLAAAIFALHPVQVESVAWITELKNILSTVFYLGAVMLYLRFDDRRNKRYYIAALGMFVPAMLSKTVTGTLPGALLVILWWLRGRLRWKQDVVPLVPFFIIGAGGGMITAWWELRFNRVVGPEFEFSAVEKILIAGRAVWFYLGKLFWPDNLTFIYPRWQIDPHAWWQYLFPIGVAALAAALWTMRHRSRAPLAAFLFFCGTLFPVLGFFNLYTHRYSFAANHYQYLASLGIIALASAAVASSLDRQGLRHAGKVLPVLLLAALATLTWRLSRDFSDAETLYRATIRRDPSSWMAHTNLSGILIDTRAEEALGHAREALRLKPDHAPALNNLGLAMQKLGRLEEAKTAFVQALKFTEYAQAHNNLGYLLQVQNHFAEAEAQYRQALKISPKNPEAHYNLGNVLQLTGRLGEAVMQYRETLQIIPGFTAAHYNLGLALQRMGRHEEAAKEYREVLRFNPDLAEAYCYLGIAMEELGRFEEARGLYTEALRRKPALEEAHTRLNRVTARIR